MSVLQSHGFAKTLTSNIEYSYNVEYDEKKTEDRNLTSKMIVCSLDTLSTSSAFKYGSGNGFALSHSLPIMTVSKKSESPTSDIKRSALGLGALVTAARFKPRSSIHFLNLCNPSIGFRFPFANLYFHINTQNNST